MLRHSLFMLRRPFMLRNSMSRWHLRKTGLLLSMIFTLVFSLAPLSHAQDFDGTIRKRGSSASATLKAKSDWTTVTVMKARP